MRGMPGWRAYLELENPGTILWKNESPLTTILLEDPGWCRVFVYGDSEQGYSVFVQRSWLDAHGAELSSDDCGVKSHDHSPAREE